MRNIASTMNGASAIASRVLAAGLGDARLIFFFQAEDGIRDADVTGVQTCALPISDGDRLSGVLVKPENFDPTKKYPMVVYIYERLSDNLHHFVDPRPGHNINASVYASNGYLIL